MELDILKNISISRFKAKVKKKAKWYAFYSLLEKKESKMENLFYIELKLQKYLHLENMNQIEAQTIFSYRTRMSKFGDNYCGVGWGPIHLLIMYIVSKKFRECIQF